MHDRNQDGGAGIITLWAVGGILLLVVGLPLLGAALGIINLPFLNLGKRVELNQGVITRTFDTDYCLANYAWFKDTYQDIKQTEVKVSTAEQQLKDFEASAGERSKWTFEDKQQYNTLTNAITGLKNYRADISGQYNSRSEQLNKVACKELPLFVNP